MSLLVGLLVFLVGAVSLGSQASAEKNPEHTVAYRNQVFYAYLKNGEKFDYKVSVIRDVTGLPAGQPAMTTEFLANDGNETVDQTCTVNTGTIADPQNPAPNKICSYTYTNTGGDGVVALRVLFPVDDYNIQAEWDVNVKNTSNDNISGRIWTGLFAIYQSYPTASGYTDYPFSSTPSVNVQNWYVSKDGYVYRGAYNDYHGIYSGFRANPYGVVYSNTCTPYYGSVEMNQVGSGNPYEFENECGGAYKLFFSPPNDDLPERATLWNGKETWVKPEIKDPSITEIAFDSNEPGSRAGKLKFNLAGYTGTVKVKFDTNNDGTFDIEESMNAESGMNEFEYSGNDKDGNPVPNNQEVGISIEIDKLAEIHFVNGDAERRAGGIEVNRLNGPIENRNTIYWDDTKLTGERCNATSPSTDGTAGVDSSGGVHGWSSETGVCPDNPSTYASQNNGTGSSWGDQRYINDWAYVPIDVKMAYSIPAELSSDLEVVKELVSPKQSYNTGDTVTYKIKLLNRGPDPAKDVEVTDTHSDNIRYISHEAPDGTSYTPQSGVWTVPAIDVGQTIELMVSFTIDSNPAEFWNQAEVTKSSNPDPDSDPANCSAAPTEDDCFKTVFKQQAQTPGKGIGVPVTGALIGKIIAGATGLALAAYLGRDMFLRNQKKHKSER